MSDPSSPVEIFWDLARTHARLNPVPVYFGPTPLEVVIPPAWSFGADPEMADALLALVLDGTKTATASALWDYEVEDAPLPVAGNLSIVLDGRDVPRALIACTDVRIVPFDEVDAEHAHLEGEGDRSLEFWREAHERFFTEVASHHRGFHRDMPVVCERFQLVYAAE